MKYKVVAREGLTGFETDCKEPKNISKKEAENICKKFNKGNDPYVHYYVKPIK